ncbi:MAG: hypothetical protein J6A88_08580 [Oscillospiraceae bacterium]|nr:hypothetical protein [Oscillospiraceae bacterium]
MYCINCGIELSPGQAICPICKTKVCHPDFPADQALATYPARPFQSEEYNRRGLMFVLTVIWTLLTFLPVGLEWMLFRDIGWSGFVSGGMGLAYLLFFLPAWFKNPNPVIFVPSGFAAVGLYLLYINLASGGSWFMSFALPVTGFLMLIVTTICALLRYLRRGRLYIIGGGLIALGFFSVYLEFFIYYTFETISFVFWSLFPLVAFVLLGMMLITVAIVKPFKESLRKYFYM